MGDLIPTVMSIIVPIVAGFVGVFTGTAVHGSQIINLKDRQNQMHEDNKADRLETNDRLNRIEDKLDRLSDRQSDRHNDAR